MLRRHLTRGLLLLTGRLSIETTGPRSAKPEHTLQRSPLHQQGTGRPGGFLSTLFPWVVLLATFPLEKVSAPKASGPGSTLVHPPCPTQAQATSGSLPLSAHCRSYTAIGAASGPGKPRSHTWCRLSTRERTHECQYFGCFLLGCGGRAVSPKRYSGTF